LIYFKLCTQLLFSMSNSICLLLTIIIIIIHRVFLYSKKKFLLNRGSVSDYASLQNIELKWSIELQSKQKHNLFSISDWCWYYNNSKANMVVIPINILLRSDKMLLLFCIRLTRKLSVKTSSAHIQVAVKSCKGLACQMQTLLPEWITNSVPRRNPKNKNRIWLMSDDDLISCFVTTKQEALHDRTLLSLFYN
jgi:hypothetical protein